MLRRVVALWLVVAVSSCGGGEAATCEELVDQTIDLAQKLIDEVEDELGDRSLDEILATGIDDLPSLERFRERSTGMNERAEELGCSAEQLGAEVRSRLGELEATTPIGELIVNAIRSGGL